MLFVIQGHLKANTIDSLQLVIKNSNDSIEKVNAYFKLAKALQKSDLLKSTSFARNGLRILTNTFYSVEQGKTEVELLILLGRNYTSMGFYNLATDNFIAARDKARQIKLPILEARSLNAIGNIYWFIDDFEKALPYYKSYIKVGQDIQDQQTIETGTMNVGITYLELNQYDSAFLFLSQALKLAERSDLKDFAGLAHMNFGWYLKEIGSLNESLRYYLIAEREYVSYLPAHYVVFLYQALAELNLMLGNLSNAEYYTGKAKKASEDSNSDFLLMYYYDLKYKIDSAKNNKTASLESKIKYLQLAKSIEEEKSKKTQSSIKLLHEIDQKERELTDLKVENEYQKLELQRNRARIAVGIIILAFLLLLVLLIYFAYRLKSKTSRILFKNNLALKEQKEELKTLNEELTTQKEDMYEKNLKLEVTLGQLKDTQKQLIHAEKMASLGVLASGVAHEINNPLNFIKGGIYGLNDYLRENFLQHVEGIKIYTESINEGVERAAEIVKSLSHYSHKSETKITECKIHDIIDNCLNILRNKIEDNIKVEKIYSTSNYFIKCNEGKMHQAVLNILSNAVQAIDGKGDIKIETVAQNKQLQIKISDSGSGISKENLSKIFDPFFTTKDPGEGIGLGLSITYNIIKELNGSIEIDSELLKGTVVKIALPIIEK